LLSLFEEKVRKNNEVISLLKEDLIEEKNWEKIAKIHFSWAINLFWPHDTFFTVVKQAENLLEEAKKWDKDKINIFNQVLKNEDFEKLFQEAEKFYTKFVETDVVSISTLRFLLNIWRKIKLEKNAGKDENWKEKDFFEYWTWRSELFYHLGRNYKGDIRWWEQKIPNDKKLKIEFRNYIDGMLLKNKEKEFKSLVGWNNNLFDSEVGEKLIVMMNWCLYRKRAEDENKEKNEKKEN
jgi:hypothetical protein